MAQASSEATVVRLPPDVDLHARPAADFVRTAMGFAAFADAPVEAGVVEVGLGGRWDATNVVDGTVAVVTPIGLDHAEFLGTDVVEIAREKAGIIKPGAVAVLAAQDRAVARRVVGRGRDLVDAEADDVVQALRAGEGHHRLLEDRERAGPAAWRGRRKYPVLSRWAAAAAARWARRRGASPRAARC